MTTLGDIRRETGIGDIHSFMNRGVVLDPWLFNAMESDDFSYKGRKSYDFDVHLDDYGRDLQRPYVWERCQQSEFIRTIVLEKPIDDLVVVIHTFSKNGDCGNIDAPELIQVIDGKQRLLTIHKFLHNEFPISVNGKDVYWSDFNHDLQMFFRSRVNCITANVYYSDDSCVMSDREKIILFNYYNFSGTPQTEEHKRMLQGLINGGNGDESGK